MIRNCTVISKFEIVPKVVTEKCNHITNLLFFSLSLFIFPLLPVLLLSSAKHVVVVSLRWTNGDEIDLSLLICLCVWWHIPQNVWLFLNVIRITSCRVTQKSRLLRLIRPITVYSDRCQIRLWMIDASKHSDSPLRITAVSLDGQGWCVYIMFSMGAVISEKAYKAGEWGNWMNEEPFISPSLHLALSFCHCRHFLTQTD